MTTLYDVPVRTIDGTDQTLAPFRGNVLLIVNTASVCGLTPQYAALEELHRELGPKGLAVLGFPCNQFGAQEPGSEQEIAAFCTSNYGVSFPMFAKIDVNGDATHPLFRLLKEARPGVLGTEAIKWNFTKFLVGRDGTVLKRYAPTDTPESMRGDVEQALRAAPGTTSA